MDWRRKGALFLLVIVALWAAVPALACVPLGHSMTHRSCCCGMVGDCITPGMSMSNSCCYLNGTPTPTTPTQLLSPENAQNLAVAHDWATVQSTTSSTIAEVPDLVTPPLKSPPGAGSILRI